MREHSHPDIDDDELLERFGTNTLPAFPHEEHAMAVANGNPGAGSARPAPVILIARPGPPSPRR